MAKPKTHKHQMKRKHLSVIDLEQAVSDVESGG